MKLISMTDFVLEHPASTDYEWQLGNHLKYANFLKQPLNIGMFVPCDDNGNVLEEPFNKGDLDYFYEKKDKYEKAKNKVLFEGFEIHELNEETKRLTCANGVFNIAWYNLEKGWYLSNGIEGMTIEDLLKYELELTESAIKQIGL